MQINKGENVCDDIDQYSEDDDDHFDKHVTG